MWILSKIDPAIREWKHGFRGNIQVRNVEAGLRGVGPRFMNLESRIKIREFQIKLDTWNQDSGIWNPYRGI